MVKPIVLCDHCGSECQRVVKASLGGRELHFCCKGCLEVYRAVRDLNNPTQGFPEHQADPERGSDS